MSKLQAIAVYFLLLIIILEMKKANKIEPSVHSQQIVSEDRRTISVNGSSFILNGQPFQIISGSLHYFRIPAAYWRDRLQKLKIAGLNSVSTYVEWSFHEPEEREYDFEGDRDIASFIKIAAEEGLHVLLRPGPYISAERDLGGFPYWILGKYPDIALRTNNTGFIRETKIWMDKLFVHLTPLLFGKGGPIIMVQIENEYGSYGNDIDYKTQLSNIYLNLIGSNALLYTADASGESFFSRGSIPGALVTINFGPKPEKTESYFNELIYKYNSSIPLMNSEYYSGWFSSWKEEVLKPSDKSVITIGTYYRNNFVHFKQAFETMLYNKINVNIYLFCGGSNFEFTSGASYHYSENVKQNYSSSATEDPDEFYLPITTSYDYGAPVTEDGDPTFKYYVIRQIIKNFKKEDDSLKTRLKSQKGNYGNVSVNFKVNLLSHQGRKTLGVRYKDVSGPVLPTFESLRQRSGLLLYETRLENSTGLLEIKKPRDLIFVFVDGVLKGNLSRMDKIYSLPITSQKNSVLSLLVENQGRIHYGWAIHDFKGILSEVVHNNKVLDGPWNITGYPLMNVKIKLDSLNSEQDSTQGPMFFEGRFQINGTPFDTYLDPSGWDKGYSWINGHNLGRYWPTAGPQVTLYVPGVWLKPAPEENLIQILELGRTSKNLSLQFIDYPIVIRYEP